MQSSRWTADNRAAACARGREVVAACVLCVVALVGCVHCLSLEAEVGCCVRARVSVAACALLVCVAPRRTHPLAALPRLLRRRV